jgi:DNA-binding response OmpR family regulator
MARILLLEDDGAVREDIGETLRQWGHSVALAADLDGAYLAMRSQSPDLILCDINLPYGSGFDLLRHVTNPTSGLSDTRVILISSNSDENSMLYGEWCGAADYIVKPVEFDALRKLIDLRLQNRDSWWMRMLVSTRPKLQQLTRMKNGAPKQRAAFGTRR